MNKILNHSLLASLLMLALTAGLTLTACTSIDDNPAAPADDWRSDVPAVAKDIAGLEKYQTPIDYSEDANWLSKPETADKAVDVFFVYPTTAGYREPTEIVDIDDAVMVEGAKGTMVFQASVFAESCNVFAPYYRQISLPATGTNYQQIIDYISQFDATRALDYYFEHLNQGRPFIIAGHSQGAATVISLLGHYLKQHPEYQERMVAAYPIGFSVTRQWLAENPQLKFAEGPTDTGVVVTWNTEGPGNKQAGNVCVLPGAISINPINWKRDDTYAPAADNLGSHDRNTGEITTPGIADAQLDVERGVVIVTTPVAAAYVMAPEVQFLFGPESYHGQDYSFFYNNLKQNVADRIAAFLDTEEPGDDSADEGPDGLAAFMSHLVVRDSLGRATGFCYGRALDEADPSVLSIGVKSLNEADEIFRSFIADTLHVVSLGTGNIVYSPTDPQGRKQGEIYLTPGGDGTIARITFSPDITSDELSEVRFIDEQLWPENAASQFTVGQIYVPVTYYEIGPTNDYTDYYVKYESKYADELADGSPHLCLEADGCGKPALLIWIADFKVSYDSKVVEAGKYGIWYTGTSGKGYNVRNAYNLKRGRPDTNPLFSSSLKGLERASKILSANWDTFVSAYGSDRLDDGIYWSYEWYNWGGSTFYLYGYKFKSNKKWDCRAYTNLGHWNSIMETSHETRTLDELPTGKIGNYHYYILFDNEGSSGTFVR